MNPGWRRNYIRYRSYFLNIMDQYHQRADLKMYVEILLSLTTVCIFSIFALKPTLTTIAQLLKDIDKKKETLSIIDSKIKKISQAQILYDQNRSKIEKMNSVLSQQVSPSTVIRQIEGLSSENGIQVINMTLGESVLLGSETSGKNKNDSENKIINSDFVTMSLRAQTQMNQYPQLYNFLSSIDRLRIPFKISSISFVPSKIDLESDSISLVLGGKVYFFKNNVPKTN